MRSTRLHRLTAVYLAVLYGVIGLTGESLHYLGAYVTELCSNPPSDDEIVVYYHVHAPDFHGHFHHAIVHHHHSNGATALAQAAGQSNADKSITPETLTHEPHACPILSLVSTLKLHHSVGCTPSIFGAPLVASIHETRTLLSREVVLDSLARGPPGGTFAYSRLS